jgi:polysaccharide pyruvyl transferase WcaK-like protein
MEKWPRCLERAPRIIRLALRPIREFLRWITVAAFMLSVDAVVVPGTGILDDFGMQPHQMPYELFRWSALSHLLRRPMVLLSVGAGPIEHPTSRRLISRVTRWAASVSYRDRGSRAFMMSIDDRNAQSTVQPDVVFGLPVPNLVDRPETTPLRIGVGVMSYSGWANDPATGVSTLDSYIEREGVLVADLLALGYSVRLLVGEASDECTRTRIIEHVRADPRDLDGGSIIAEPMRDFDELLAQVAQCDAVIATRYHNIVAALMLCRPTISIGYADKNRELMSIYSLDEFCHHAEEFEPDRVIGDLKLVMRHADELSKSMCVVNGNQRCAVEAQYDDTINELVRRKGMVRSTAGANT